MNFLTDAALHHKFLENMHDAVLILDENYQILYCNHIVALWYGYTTEEIQSLTLSDLRIPSERVLIKSQMQRVAAQDGGLWETTHLRKDGSTFAVEISSTPLIVGDQKRFYHVVRDISARKKTEQALRASEDRYRKIVENFPDPLFIHRDNKITFINAAGIKLFGATDESQIVGKSIWSLYPSESHGMVRVRNQMIMQSRKMTPSIEHAVLRLDGTRAFVKATSYLIEYEGDNFFYVILHEVSDSKKTQMCLDMQYAVSHSLVDSETLVNATRNAIDAICKTWGFGYGKIWAWDKKDKILRYVSSWSDGKDTDKITEKVYSCVAMNNGDGLPGKVMSTGLSLWIEDLSKEPAGYYPQGFKYTTVIAIPIKSEEELIGVMELVCNTKMAVDQVILQALTGVGQQIGLFLKRKKFEKDLFYLAKHDPITGLSNRAFFEDTLAFEINLAESKEQLLAVLFLDIDSFHTINEGMGHAAGDSLLRDIAIRLVNININSEKLGRFGPQFAIILNSIDTVNDINIFINKILTCTSEEFLIQDQSFKIQFNIGIAQYPNDGHEVIPLMRSASIALNCAKEIGGGAIQFCTKELNERAKNRIRIESDLHSALENQEFILYYQPIVEVPALQTIGFESLIRWVKDDRMISPTEFVPIVEKNHLIIPIGEWIIRTASAQCTLWQHNTTFPVSVAVNISPVQFNHSGVIDVLQAALQDTGLSPDCLKVEITEGAIMSDVGKSVGVLKKIKDMGIKVSIDDFGTGYSSLNYLRHLPIDFLKIDQSFVRNMTSDPNDAAIVKTIIELADNLGYKVIAEGVETQAQLSFLSTLGCHFIQGYYFSTPLCAADATEFLKQGKLLG